MADAEQVLTRKQQAFVEHYLCTWNASAAARAAGYRGDANTVGPRLLKRSGVAAAIAARLQALALSADEVLARLSQQATANLADFFTFDAAGRVTGLNSATFQARGYLVKKIKLDGDRVEIELYDAQAALVQMGKSYALFVERAEINAHMEVTGDEIAAARARAAAFEQTLSDGSGAEG